MRRFVGTGLACLMAACGSPPPGASVPPPGGRPPAGLVAFETIRSVLQHPRCQNCHPPGDAPLQGDDGHAHTMNVQRGPTGTGRAGEECSTCHGPANPPASFGDHVPPGSPEGWHMPPPEERLVFVGRTARELCAQLSDPARNGGKDPGALRAHLDTPLVTWGWEPGLGRAPVAVPRAAFLAAWETWAGAGRPCPE